MFGLRRKQDDSAQSDKASTTQYEVAELAIQHGFSIFEARRILREAGADRQKAEAAAQRLKATLRSIDGAD